MSRIMTVPSYPDPAALYPQVAAVGSLAAALQAVVVELGLSVRVPVTPPSSLYRASVPATVPFREDLEVYASYVEPCWVVRGCESAQGLALIEGITPDLTQVARAAQARHDGVALADFPRIAPFVDIR